MAVYLITHRTLDNQHRAIVMVMAWTIKSHHLSTGWPLQVGGPLPSLPLTSDHRKLLEAADHVSRTCRRSMFVRERCMSLVHNCTEQEITISPTWQHHYTVTRTNDHSAWLAFVKGVMTTRPPRGAYQSFNMNRGRRPDLGALPDPRLSFFDSRIKPHTFVLQPQLMFRIRCTPAAATAPSAPSHLVRARHSLPELTS